MRRSLRTLSSRRLLATSSHSRRAVATAGSLLVLAFGGLSCSSGDSGGSQGDDDELQALLQDGKLSSLSVFEVRSEPGLPTPIDPDGGPFATTGGAESNEGTSGGSGGSLGKGGSPEPSDAGTVGVGATTTTTSGGSGGFGGFGSTSGGTGGFGGFTSSSGTSASSGGVGGFTSSSGVGGGKVDGGPPFRNRPMGRWEFNSCSPTRTDLVDSSFNNHTAFRSVSTKCAPDGIEGMGLGFASAKDIAFVPDQPDFTFEQGVTVAAWVNPDRVDDTRTIFRKRLIDTSSFVLLVHRGQFRFVALLSNGRAVTVASKAVAKKWTHVAATYDNETLRLFIDGKEADKFKVRGVINNGDGPLLMGNDLFERRLVGKLDNVVFDTMPMSAAEIAALTCVRSPATVEATPTTSPPLPPGSAFNYALRLTSHDSASCAPRSYFFNSDSFTPGISVFATPPFVTLPAGGNTGANLTVRSSPDVEPDIFPIPFSFFPNGTKDAPVRGQVQYVVAEPTTCHVSTPKELLIRHLSVVDDPVRTTFNGSASDARTGAWTFGKLIEDLSPTKADAPAVAEEMLKTWLTDQTINGFRVDARPTIQKLVLDQFPRTPDGKLDLHRAPLQLLAIVNRFDLNLTEGSAGEGRFIFGVLGPGGFPLEFTFILEYQLPATNEKEVQKWAEDWHALSSLPFPSEVYNAALQNLTDRFAGRNVAPTRPNGSGILQVRSNEIALSFVWELRQFELSPTTGHLVPTPLPLTPDLSFNRTDVLGEFINANEASIIAETHTVPATFLGQPFQAGAVFNDLSVWSAPGVNNNEARFRLSLNTCNGCHSQETNTTFLQIGPRFPGQTASLSPFLTGTVVFDQQSGQPRALNELNRRNRILHVRVCPDTPPPAEPTVDAGPRPTFDAGPRPTPLDAGRDVSPVPFDASTGEPKK